MKIINKYLNIKTKGKGTYEFTDNAFQFIKNTNISDGTLNVFLMHTSCSLIIMENADSTARDDLHEFYNHLVPENQNYFKHTHEGSDDMPSHIKMTLNTVSINIPVIDKSLTLGTWQGIFLFEHRKNPHSRKIVLQLIGE